MKPTLNEIGKICFLGQEVSGASVVKAGYTIEAVLELEDENEQRALLDKIERNRRLELAKASAEGVSFGGVRAGGVDFGTGTVVIHGDVTGRDKHVRGGR